MSWAVLRACVPSTPAVGLTWSLTGPISNPLELLRLTRSAGVPLWRPMRLRVGILKLADAVPSSVLTVRCRSVSPFAAPARSHAGGARLAPPVWTQHIAFYDDALLFQPDQTCCPSAARSCSAGWNTLPYAEASMARFITKDLRACMCKQCFGRYLALRAVHIRAAPHRRKVYAP